MDKEKETSLKKVSSRDLDKFQTKKDIYEFLAFKSKYLTWNIERMHLPTYRKTSMQFLKQILSKEKRLLPKEKVTVENVPRFQELSTKELLVEIKDDPKITQFLPSFDLDKN